VLYLQSDHKEQNKCGWRALDHFLLFVFQCPHANFIPT
jgi:hypothetical protein